MITEKSPWRLRELINFIKASEEEHGVAALNKEKVV
jgi:hypothetical protein